MFPIRDDNPSFLRPYATLAIIAANLGSWIFVQGLGFDPGLGRSICEFGMVPGDLLGALPAGTRWPVAPGLVCVVTEGSSWYTLVSHMFLHGGWLHLIGNLWFLWIFGNNVEDAMGHVRFVVFYLLCGLAAAGLQLASSPESAVPMVGASGAIGGVMGGYVLLYPRVRVHLLVFLGIFVTVIAVPAMFMLAYWFLLQLLGGFAATPGEGGGVAFWAHVGGFIAGCLLIFLFRDPALVDRHPNHGWHPSQRRKSWSRVDRFDA